MRPSFLQTTGLVTWREFKRSFFTRATIMTLLIVLLIVAAMAILPRFLSSGGQEATIAVSGASQEQIQTFTSKESELGVDIQATDKGSTVPDGADALWEIDPNGSNLIVNESSQQQDVTRTVELLRLAALDGEGEASELSAPAVSAVQANDDEALRLIIAYFVVIMGINLIVGTASLVAQRCIEEKGNRVIDILLPRFNLHGFLCGKVFGTGLAGLAQFVLMGLGAGLILALAGRMSVVLLVLSVLPHAVLWYVLGFLFFGFLYAGLGSLLKSPTEGAALQAPLQLLNMGLFVVAIIALQTPKADWVLTLAAIPPFSLALGPLVSVTSGWDTNLLIGALLTFAAVLILSAIGVKLYRWGIVNEDWKKLFSRS